MHARVLVLVAVFSISACVSLTSIKARNSCESGMNCKVEGVLAIESRWQASLDFDHGCLALAVPESFYVNQKYLDGRRALVLGKVFSQPQDSPGTFSYGYEIRGMRVNTNLCEFAILVDEIRSGDEVLWVRVGAAELQRP